MPLISHLRRAASFIPQPLRGRLASWRYGYSPTGLRRPTPPWIVERDHIQLSVEGLQVTLPRSWEQELDFQFCRNLATRAELLALIRQAKHRPGGVLFDVGAENGLFSLLYCAAAAANRAVLFEPAPPTIEEEKAVFARNRLSERATFRQAAINDTEGICGGLSEEYGFVRLLPAGQGTFEVALVTLDGEARRLGITPDVIKIDVEGHELHVLRGATELLRAKPVLFVELHADLLRLKGQQPSDVVALLQQFGYRFYSHNDRELAPRRIARTLHAVLRFRAA